MSKFLIFTKRKKASKWKHARCILHFKLATFSNIAVHVFDIWMRSSTTNRLQMTIKLNINKSMRRDMRKIAENVHHALLHFHGVLQKLGLAMQEKYSVEIKLTALWLWKIFSFCLIAVSCCLYWYLTSLIWLQCKCVY